MRIRALSIAGGWAFTPVIHEDSRGAFCEGFTATSLAAATGRSLDVAQINVSTSSRGVVRGVHYADVPPGQAKYVQCISGSILDVVVDIRVGSPTFGSFDAVLLDDITRQAVFIEEGLGHAFCVLSDQASVAYATSTPYDPALEHTVNALDPDLALPWPTDLAVVLSERDSAAPSLADALERGLLPRAASS